MKKTRRRYGKELKLKIVLEALSERMTLPELSQKYEVHPNQISLWKKQFLDNAATYMQGPALQDRRADDELDKLYSKIGQLQMEVDFLKKKLFN